MAGTYARLRQQRRRARGSPPSSGCPAPCALRRYAVGAPLVDGPVLVGGLGDAPVGGPRAWPARAPRASRSSTTVPERPGASRRRRRPHRRPRARPTSSRCGRCVAPGAASALGPSGRVVVVGPRPRRRRQPARRPRPAGPRGHHPLGRQGAAGRGDRQPRPRRRRRGGQRRRRPAVPALRPLGLRRRPGGPGRRRRAQRSPRTGDRPLAGKVAVVTGAARGHRRRDRRRARPRRGHRGLRRHPGGGGGAGPDAPTRSAAPRCSSTSPPPTPGERILDHASTPPRRASTSSCTTPASPATSCSPTWTSRAGPRCSTSTSARSCG